MKDRRETCWAVEFLNRKSQWQPWLFMGSEAEAGEQLARVRVAYGKHKWQTRESVYDEFRTPVSQIKAAPTPGQSRRRLAKTG